jgi:hypothetical protein
VHTPRIRIGAGLTELDLGIPSFENVRPVDGKDLDP